MGIRLYEFMYKGIKTQIYPTVKQKIYIDNLLGSYRFVYNKCLEYKMNEYTLKDVRVGIKELGKFFHGNLTKDDEFKWLQIHNTKVLKQAILDMLVAYKRCFVNGAGFPKFKSKKDIQSCRFPIDAISKHPVNSNHITLTKQLKNLKFACSEQDLHTLYSTKIKSATITKEKTGLYFCSFLIDVEPEKFLEAKNKACGIDLGIKSYAKIVNDSEIEEITNPKFTRNNEKILRKLNQKLSKKQKGSANREKARLRLAKKHYKITCQKNWFIHNFTTKIIKENKIIGIEDLSVSNMMKNHKLAKSIQELSLYEVKRQLIYKALKHDRKVIQIDRFFPSSKLCSNCGWKDKDLRLSDRNFKCKDCGLNIDRDENAAINIRNEALRILESMSREELSRIKACGDDVRLKSKKLGDAIVSEAGKQV